MNKLKIWLLLVTALAVAAMAGVVGVVYACPETGGINCSSQRIDLKLKDQDEPWRDGVRATWTALNMSPGQEYTFEGSFVGLRSNVWGTADVTCNYQVVEEQPPVEPDADPQTKLQPDRMAKKIELTRCVYRGNRWTIDCLTGKWQIFSDSGRVVFQGCNLSQWKLRDTDGDGRLTFYDLKVSPLNNLPLPDAKLTDSTRFEIGVRFAETAGNEFQGDILNMNMVFNATSWDNFCAGGGINLKDMQRFFCR